MTTSDYLEQLQQDKQDLVDNLTTQGITGLTGDETFTELVPEVLNIEAGGGGASEYFEEYIDYGSSSTAGWIKTMKKLPAFKVPLNLTSLSYAYYGNSYVEEVDFSKLETSNIQDFSYSFSSMTKLNKLDLRNLDTTNAQNMAYMFTGTGQSTTSFQFLVGNKFNTSNVTNMSYMFNNLGAVGFLLDLTQIPNFNTSNVTNMEGMFGRIKTDTVILGSNFDTRKVTTMRNMFAYGYANLKYLDLSMCYTPVLTTTQQMFNNCKSLTRIDMRNFNFSSVTNYTNMFGSSASNGVPDNCLIIVADDTQKTWITSKFSRLTNVKTVAEYEAE